MSDAAPQPPKPKKSLGGIVMIVAAFAGAAVGSGGALYGVATLKPGLLGGGHAEAPAPVVVMPTPVEYVELDNAFTSNLADTGRYLQLRIAVSNTGGPPVAAALTQHKLAIVSAVLAVLGEASEADVADKAAKSKLRAAIRAAINDVLESKAHVAGVDEVFFTTLVVQ